MSKNFLISWSVRSRLGAKFLYASRNSLALKPVIPLCLLESSVVEAKPTAPQNAAHLPHYGIRQHTRPTRPVAASAAAAERLEHRVGSPPEASRMSNLRFRAGGRLLSRLSCRSVSSFTMLVWLRVSGKSRLGFGGSESESCRRRLDLAVMLITVGLMAV